MLGEDFFCSFFFFSIASVKIRRNSMMVRIWEFQMSQIHFSLIFLKGENRRQKRRQKKDLGFVSGCYLFEVRKPEHEPVGRKENV